MPSVDQIPQARDMQTQLASIELAIDALKAGGTVTYIAAATKPPSATPDIAEPPGLATRIPVELYPAISNPASIDAIITALQIQHDALVTELEAWGYTYNGSAFPTDPTPSSGPPRSQPKAPTIPQALRPMPPPPPPVPFVPPIPPLPLDPVPSATLPPVAQPDMGTPPVPGVVAGVPTAVELEAHSTL